MTLAVAIVTPELAFAGADRRYGGASTLRDFKAIKICSLETTDARGLITFAGVGARAGKTPFELSSWITHVLRGYKRTLDQSLNTIAEAATEQKLHELVDGHAFGFAGFTKGGMSLYIITSAPELFSIPASGKPTKLLVPSSPSPFRVINFNIPPRQKVLGILLGSGARHLGGRMLLDFSRQVRRVRAKEIAGQRWATMWSWANRKVARREPTVGPEVMCAWRYRDGGGNHISYTADGLRESHSGALPAVGQGMPISDIAERLMTHMMDHFANNPMGDMPEMNQEITDKLMDGLSMRPNKKF